MRRHATLKCGAACARFKACAGCAFDRSKNALAGSCVLDVSNKETIMAQGKDPQTSDGLGGVHNVVTPRQPAPERLADPEPVAVAEGQRAGTSRLVDDPNQIAKVVHTEDAPIAAPNDADARESTLRPMRTPDAPHQDVQVSPDA